MAVTRDQASRLLSESEMTLFSDSRHPTLRSFSARELTRRIERTRKLRDKARDLLQRQRLGSRKHTGSKGGATGQANLRTERKGEVLEDILQRFETRLQDVQSSDDAATAPAAGIAKARKRATQAPRTKRARTTAITPEQALAQTRELLQAKHERDREPRAYQALDEHIQSGHTEAGYQSGSAKARAQELHAGEVRLDPIQGSISTRDRHSQGKRDHR